MQLWLGWMHMAADGWIISCRSKPGPDTAWLMLSSKSNGSFLSIHINASNRGETNKAHRMAREHTVRSCHMSKRQRPDFSRMLPSAITAETCNGTAAAAKLPCSATATNACMQRKVSIANPCLGICESYAAYQTPIGRRRLGFFPMRTLR